MSSPSERRVPLYIVSKGRADTRVTNRYLAAMGVPHYVVVEEQEADLYRANVELAEVLVLPPHYKTDYDCFDDLGLTKSTGPGPARNFAWDHSIENGADWHWVMDDNIKGFYRFNYNLKTPCVSPTFWTAQEDFCMRYKNVAMAGPNYFMFIVRKDGARPPYVLNTRIYSCNLIRNDAPFRWRGRYNEDTDLSLRMLKGGWCTVQFNAFLQDKMATQALAGGNTEAFYAEEGTYAKSKMLADMHPDVAKVTYRFSRVHHHVDYNPWKTMPLEYRDDFEPPTGIDNYGMELQQFRHGKWSKIDQVEYGDKARKNYVQNQIAEDEQKKCSTPEGEGPSEAQEQQQEDEEN